MPTKACPNEALMSRAEECAKEGKEVDWQKDEQRRGEALHERRGVRLHSHDTPYGKAIRLLMRLFPTVSDDLR
jgi:hypothetical protein